MKDPNLAILNAYKTALTGMSFGTTNVPVYSQSTPLANVPKKYVLLTSQTKLQNETGCGYWYECTIAVDIVTRYPNGTGDITFAMVVGEEVAQRIQVNGISISDFNVRDSRQLSTTNLALQTDEENIYRYIITFEHKLNRT